MKDRVGETRVMNCGLNATIIAYHNSGDVDVEFENGELARGCTYTNFIRRTIKCPMVFKEIDDYIECTNLNTNPPAVFLISKGDVEKVKKAYWCIATITGYVKNTNIGRLHRYLFDFPKGVDIDHINGNRLDNRRNNLRICTRSNNNCNKGKHKKNCSSNYKGVRLQNTGKWNAQITIEGRGFNLGYFDTETEAAVAYNNAAIDHHGEFARLNDV